MIIRPVTQEDIKTIWNDEYEFKPPDLNKCRIKASIEDNGELICIGAIRIVGDISILHHGKVDNLKKANAIRMLFSEAILQAKRNYLDTLYAFTDDDKWAKQIKKHYGFIDINRPNKLVLEI